MNIKLIKERDESLSLVEQILYNRDIKDYQSFLNTSYSEIQEPFYLTNINKAIDIFYKHILDKNCHILIQVDCDLDGYVSGALLYNYLKANFLNINIDYQVHDDKTHGLEITDKILNKEYDLIFIPDAGSNQHQEHKQLYDLGIDIIVLDHHEYNIPEQETAIIVNNQNSNDYKNKFLSGVGVVWQFCRMLDQTIENLRSPSSCYLDLVQLGLCGDMMDIRSLETKKLIEIGLEQIENQYKFNNTFLNYLIHKQSYSMTGNRDYMGQKLTPMNMSFYIVPMINSITRFGTHEERDLVFKAFLDEFAENIVSSTKRGHKPDDTETICEQAARVAANVKSRQDKAKNEYTDKILKDITEEYLQENSIIIIDTRGEVSKNINGLVANQIMGKFHRPVIVGTILEEEGIRYFRGSARGPGDDLCLDFRSFVLNTELMDYAEGHANAFGVSILEENLEQFKNKCNEQLLYKKQEPSIIVDFIFEANELTYDDIADIASLKYCYGTGCKEALICIKNLRITYDNKTLMSPDKKPTLKIFENGIAYIKFGITIDFFNSLAPNRYTDTYIDLVGKCNLNEWNGRITPQILIDNLEVKMSKIDF